MIEIQKSEREILRPFFHGSNDSLIWSYLDGCMGRAFADHPARPRCAKIVTTCFAFLAGDHNAPGAAELISCLPDDMGQAFQLFVPENDGWTKRIEERYDPGQIKKITRYAIRKEGDLFDRERLRSFTGALDARFSLRRIDGDLYDACISDDLFRHFCGNFESKEDFLTHGIGFVVLKDGGIVSGASSYSYYGAGIEVEIDTKEEFRRMGLATAAGARLILACLEENRYPSWDAANMESVHLAEKLGYRFSHAYNVYFAPLSETRKENP